MSFLKMLPVEVIAIIFSKIDFIDFLILYTMVAHDESIYYQRNLLSKVDLFQYLPGAIYHPNFEIFMEMAAALNNPHAVFIKCCHNPIGHLHHLDENLTRLYNNATHHGHFPSKFLYYVCNIIFKEENKDIFINEFMEIVEDDSNFKKMEEVIHLFRIWRHTTLSGMHFNVDKVPQLCRKTCTIDDLHWTVKGGLRYIHHLEAYTCKNCRVQIVLYDFCNFHLSI